MSAKLRQMVFGEKRHPGDVVRMAAGIVALAILTGLAFGGHVSLTEAYLFRFINSLPGSFYPAVWVVMQAGTFGFVWVAVIGALIVKRYRLAMKLAIGGTVAWLLAKIGKVVISRDRPAYLLHGIADRAHANGVLGFPSGHATVAAVLATIISPYVSKSWRRFIWLLAWIVAFARVYGGAHLPLDVLAGMCLGWVIGSAVNFAFGTPVWPLPVQTIKSKLLAAGIKVASIKVASVDARGSTPLFITAKDKGEFFAKFVNTENRDADFLFRFWRQISLRVNEGEEPYASAIQLIEHEAYLYTQAAGAGAAVPKVLFAAPVTNRSALLVAEKIIGKTLDRYDQKLTPSLLRKIWEQAYIIHGINLAHRDLRTANLMVDDKKQPWLIDFGFAALVSTKQQLAIDRAELLTSLALAAASKAVVTAAVQVFGPTTIGETLPYMQPESLARSTRDQIKKQDRHLLESLKSEIMRQTGAKPTAPIKLRRISHQEILWLSLVLVLVIVAVTQINHINQYLAALQHMNPWWLAAALFAAVMTYVTSAVVVTGSTTSRLVFSKVFLLQFATTFINRVTPYSVGSAVLIQRFLENSGIKRVSAIASTSVIYIAGGITHVVLLAVVATIFVHFPIRLHLSHKWLVILGITLLISLVVILIAPKTRTYIEKYAVASIKSIGEAVTRPLNALQLFGGSAGVSFFYALALYFSLRVFGANLAFDKVLLIYLAGDAIASVSPTPGKLGATEIALITACVTFGVHDAAAVLSVLVFRVLTYWLPTIPGIFAFRYLQKDHLLDF